ncbi:hypothetical protein ABW20_dc0109846 [Dactylellina cionopaga]|nr:hypothetical protein ABW20_dc0109846 [Dactylellina cionopaga]
MDVSLEEQIAQLVLDSFHALPPRCKPRADPKSGLREWVPMSAVVLRAATGLHLAALATGSKCLPAHLLPKCSGLVLHDSHSEILALRGLNRLLLQEAHRTLTHPTYASPFLIRNRGGEGGREHPFRIDPSTTIHLFSTEAPCGDASMEFIMTTQPDATPWPVPSKLIPPANMLDLLPGRSYFSELSIVRRKPSRQDAPPTLSKSCTDKLTLRQFTSVLSSLSSLLISPERAYISTFTVPFDKYNNEAYTRAFTTDGRLSDIRNGLNSGFYTFTPFTVTPLPETFEYVYAYSKPPSEDTKSKTSHISVLCINHISPDEDAKPPPLSTEFLISGVKQGNGQLSASHDDRKGSLVCRKKMWQLAREIVDLLGDETLKTIINTPSYGDIKTNAKDRNDIKCILIGTLKGWEKNGEDDKWGL